MPEIQSGYTNKRVVNISKNAGETDFRTITQKSGVQWASCNKSISNVDETRYLQLGPEIGHPGGGGVNWTVFLFLIPGAAVISIAFLPGVALATAASIGVMFATMVAALTITLVGATTAQIIGQALFDLSSLFPSRNLVQFVKFEKPCSEDAGAGF